MNSQLKKLLFYIPLVASITLCAQQVKDFSLVNVADGKTVSLNQFKQHQLVVVVFTGNDCPYMEYYRDRLALLSAAWPETVQFLFINSHPEPSEGTSAMKTKYSQWGIGAPYLADKGQVVMDMLEAQKSPEVFLLKKGNGLYTVVYRGAIDDNPQVAGDVNHNYLKEAIDSMIAGKNPGLAKTRPIGCTIRKK